MEVKLKPKAMIKNEIFYGSDCQGDSLKLPDISLYTMKIDDRLYNENEDQGTIILKKEKLSGSTTLF